MTNFMCRKDDGNDVANLTDLYQQRTTDGRNVIYGHTFFGSYRDDGGGTSGILGRRYTEQTKQRKALTQQSRDTLSDIIERINSGRYDDPVVTDLLLKLSEQVKRHKGKTVYIAFTTEQRERARKTDLVELLRSQGESLKRSGKEWEWRDGSAKVTIRGNLWFHQYDRTGGDAIDFVRRFYDKSYPQAMEYLLGNGVGTLVTSSPVVKETKPFALPPKNESMWRVYGYLLNRRKIDKDVLNAFVSRQMIYESLPYHNVVFVGCDADGVPRHASMRGTGSESTYKGNVPNSRPEYSFHWHGTSDTLYLFEAPIDMLSFISMHKGNWRDHSYAACCGVSDQVMWQMMRDNPHGPTRLLIPHGAAAPCGIRLYLPCRQSRHKRRMLAGHQNHSSRSQIIAIHRSPCLA